MAVPIAFQGIQKDSAGYKLLQLMGWKEGKGLGMDESGITQHLRVKKHVDRQGIGINQATEKSRKEWEQNAVNYEAVLKRLQEVRCKTASSRKTKRRKKMINDEDVKSCRHAGRYSKQERAKLISSYSATDLAAILGKNPTSTDSQSDFGSQVVSVQAENASTSSGDDDGWWKSIFVHGGTLSPLQRKYSPDQRRGDDPKRRYSEYDQAKLCSRAQRSAQKSKQGLGKRRKIAGVETGQGTKTTFDSSDDNCGNPISTAKPEESGVCNDHGTTPGRIKHSKARKKKKRTSAKLT